MKQTFILSAALLVTFYTVNAQAGQTFDNSNSFNTIDKSDYASYNYNAASNGTLHTQVKSFQSILQEEKIKLHWQVAENEAGDYFEVEKSTDGRSFKTIAIVATTENQGDEAYTYAHVLQGTAYYRLKVVNKNKSLSYSDAVFAKEQTTAASALNLVQNPVKQSLRFTFKAESAGTTEAIVYSLDGTKIYEAELTVQKGVNSLSTNLSNVNIKGAYLLEVRTADSRSVVKFLKD